MIPNRFRHTAKTLTLALAGAVLIPVLTSAQNEPSSLFIDRVDVNIINVEVFVTDKDGRRVTDLEAGDFEIYEDGDPVDISNFYTVAYEDKVTETLAQDLESLQAESPRPERQVSPEQQHNLLIYVDHFNLRPENQKRVLDNLEGFVEDRIAQGDNIMLVGYNRKIDVVQPFTHDRQRLINGLRKLKKAATHRQVDDQQRRQTMRFMLPISGGDSGGGRAGLAGNDVEQAFLHLRSYVQGARQDLRFSVQAFGNVVRSLAGLPGRKAVLYVSDGLPKRPGEELYQHLTDQFGGSGAASFGSSLGERFDPLIEALNEDESHLFNEITRHANAHQVTLYTLDARGSRGDSSGSAQFNEINGFANAAGHTSHDTLRTLNLQEPLIELAETTGGSSILNTFNFAGAFDELGQDIDSFYSLGYRSKHGGDGKYHKIDVRVKRPGLKVRHRNGFVDKPEVERVADRTLSSLLLDLEKNPLGIGIDFGEPEKKGRDKFHLPLLVRIPFDQITLLPSGDKEEGRLKIFIIVQDEEGGISSLQEIPYPVSLQRAQAVQARGQEMGYSTSLLIRSGIPKVAVGVWDELSGIESFVHKSVLVGQPKKGTKITRSR